MEIRVKKWNGCFDIFRDNGDGTSTCVGSCVEYGDFSEYAQDGIWGEDCYTETEAVNIWEEHMREELMECFDENETDQIIDQIRNTGVSEIGIMWSQKEADHRAEMCDVESTMYVDGIDFYNTEKFAEFLYDNLKPVYSKTLVHFDIEAALREVSESYDATGGTSYELRSCDTKSGNPECIYYEVKQCPDEIDDETGEPLSWSTEITF